MKPNVIFIMTDQHRLSAIGAYGETPCRTPNLDRLAQQGIRFENVYTSCPVCSPARASVMTGLFPHGHGITTNIHELGCCRHELNDRPTLLSRQLQAAGYACGYSGKWHLGTELKTSFDAPNRPVLPRDVGFDGQNFPGHGGGGFGYDDYKDYLTENGLEHTVKEWDENTKEVWSMGKLEGPVESTVPYFLVDNTIRLSEGYRNDGKPYFIWHNFWGPHGPFYAPSEYIEDYRDVEIPPWPNYDWQGLDGPYPYQAKIHPEQKDLCWDDWAMAIRYYYAFATLIDEQIGRLLDYLEDSGEIDNTVIIFSSDHGQTLGSHGGLTDKGWHHFEETHRIPLIIRLPGEQHKGKVINDLVSLTDLYPTILELAGRNLDEKQVHGQSLIPLIEGNSDGWRDCVVTEFGGLYHIATTQRMIRWKNLKYGYNNWAKDELYDLENDPHETVNQIDNPDYAGRAREMRSRLLQWMEEKNDPALNRTKFFFNRYDPIEIRAVW